MVHMCPICGQYLERHEGTYTYTWPEGSAQNESQFENAVWESCSRCGEEFLTGELVERIELSAGCWHKK